jgi:hypothetical protein
MASNDSAGGEPAAAKKSAPREAPPRKAAPRASASPPSAHRLTASAVAGRAARQLLELTGREAEGVTGLSRTEDGWTVQVEVVEARRIPDTTDILALYDVEVDGDGELVGYHRVRRYVRGKPSEG